MACPKTYAAAVGLSALATYLVLCGLAAVQNLCHTNNVYVSYQSGNVCSAAYAFQWWGWALQVTFLTLLTYFKVKGIKHGGIMTVAGTSTVLAMFFANEALKSNNYIYGKAFSRNTLLFVGWMLVATFNYFVILIEGYPACGSACTTATATCAGASISRAAAAKEAAPAGDVEVAAISA